MFSKIRFGSEEQFTLVAFDETGIKMMDWKVMKKDLPNLFRIINDKFGLNLSIKNKEEQKDKDLDWALK